MSGGPAAHGSTKFHRRIGSLAGAGVSFVYSKNLLKVFAHHKDLSALYSMYTLKFFFIVSEKSYEANECMA